MSVVSYVGKSKFTQNFVLNSHARGKSRSVNFPVKNILKSSNLAHYLLAKNAKMSQE